MTDTQDALRRSATNAASCLAAAELAVTRGNFNAAKVLRAVALAERISAVEFAKRTTATMPDLDRFETLLADFSVPLPGDVDAELHQARESIRDILSRSLQSLRDHPDILESDVNQILWGCHLCGAVAEGTRPEACRVCGAPPPDFELFAPFFAQSTERIGRLPASGIIETLRLTGARVESSLAKLSAAELDMKPSTEEWSPREIVAHMTETDRLFAERARAILAEPPGVVDGNVRPWMLHIGRGYEGLSVDELLLRQREARADTLRVVEALGPREWARRANLRGAQATLLDFGTWIANHDVGHLGQLER